MTKKQKGAEANEEKGFTKATVSVKRKEKGWNMARSQLRQTYRKKSKP